MPFDQMMTEIGNYSKGWYGNFTGGGTAAYDELKIIIGHLCGMEPKYVSDRDCFMQVAGTFHTLINKFSNPEHYFMEMYKESLFPNWELPKNKDDAADVKIMNRMLIGIAQFEKKYFPDQEMTLDPKIAMLFPNGQERINRRAECIKEWATIKEKA